MSHYNDFFTKNRIGYIADWLAAYLDDNRRKGFSDLTFDDYVNLMENGLRALVRANTDENETLEGENEVSE